MSALHLLPAALAGDPAAAAAAFDGLTSASTQVDRERLLAAVLVAARAGASLPPPQLAALAALAEDGRESDECRR